MHGQKSWRKRAMAGEAEVDGHKLFWELISEPQWASGRRIGLRVSVRASGAARREMVVEYPYDPRAYLPQRPKLTPRIVEADIRAAISEGWDPESRGRTFLFKTPTTLELGQQPASAIRRWSAS